MITHNGEKIIKKEIAKIYKVVHVSYYAGSIPSLMDDCCELDISKYPCKREAYSKDCKR